MAAIYGHRWTSAFGERCDDDAGALTVAGDTWARGLAGVAEGSIGVGLNAALMAADPWPPTLPAFRAMCLGVPSLGETRINILKKVRTPFTILVWQHLDNFHFHRADKEKADYMLKDAYEIAREHVMSGGGLPELPIAEIETAESKERKRASEETVRKHCADLEKLFGLDEQPTPDEPTEQAA